MITNFPNGVSSFGIQLPAGDLPATKGKYIFVDYGSGSDGNTGDSPENAVKTIAQAYSMATTNMDDVIILTGSASHVVTSMLTVAKNRVHFIGMDASGGRLYGQNAKISMGVTTVATDLAAMKNTGVRNSFTNIKFTSANTKDESLYGVIEAGEYAVYNNCEFYKETDLDATGAAELVLNGDSAQFNGCTVGSLANAISGDVIRANVLLTKELGGSGKVMRDCTFQNCFFWKRASHVNNRFVYAAADADVERMLIFKDCVFYNAANAAALPAQAISAAANLTVGSILVVNPAFIKCTKLSTTTGVFVVGAATGATAGLATQAA